jgi:hypothetical protein
VVRLEVATSESSLSIVISNQSATTVPFDVRLPVLVGNLSFQDVRFRVGTSAGSDTVAWVPSTSLDQSLLATVTTPSPRYVDYRLFEWRVEGKAKGIDTTALTMQIYLVLPDQSHLEYINETPFLPDIAVEAANTSPLAGLGIPSLPDPQTWLTPPGCIGVIVFIIAVGAFLKILEDTLQIFSKWAAHFKAVALWIWRLIAGAPKKPRRTRQRRATSPPN